MTTTFLISMLAVPSAVQNMCFAGGSLVIQTFSNRFGTEFIAANSMLMKIDGFVLLPMMGFSTAVTTFVGQNIGAGNAERTNRGIRSTLLISAAVTVFLSFILYFACPAITLIFGANEHSRRMAAQGIRFVCFFYVFFSMQNTFSGALRGAGAGPSRQSRSESKRSACRARENEEDSPIKEKPLMPQRAKEVSSLF